MSPNHKKAFAALQRMGVPVYSKPDEKYDTFHISTEEETSHLWADWYGNRHDWDGDSINPEIKKVLKSFELHAEWDNPSTLRVWHND